MRPKVLSWVDAVRSSYWFIPTLMSLVAVLLSFIMVRLDQQYELIWLRNLGFVFINQPDGARSLLSTVASSMIGVAGTTFSITLAVLTLTSSQFGPRLLSTFMRDTGNQVVLGTFAATFLYCLLVLRTVRDASETVGPAFVPHLAVSLAVFFAAGSLGVFIYFIHHTADSIQAATILARISSDLTRLIPKVFPEELAENAAPERPTPPLPEASEATRLAASKSGYLQAVDEAGLLAFAKERGVLVRSLHRPGTFVVEGRPLAYLWPEEELDKKSVQRARANFTLGSRRTPLQDLDFLFDQLTEVALRALSPGINDPVTAMRCLDRIGQGLSQLAARRPPSPQRYDEEGRLRLLLPEPDLEELVANTLGAIRRFSGDNLLVALHLLDTVAVVLEAAPPDNLRRALLREAHLMCETAKPVLLEADFSRLSARYDQVTE